MGTPKVGDTVWLFDANRRVYTKENRSSPIYAEHWYADEITGETRTSWLLKSGHKVDKATEELRLKETYGRRRKVEFSREAVDLNIWVNGNRYRIVDAVDKAGPEMLKAIDALLKAEAAKPAAPAGSVEPHDRTEPMAARGGALAGYLQRFTREGLATVEQKCALKKAKFIDYAHGMWALTDIGKAQAVRLGYLEA